MPATASAAPRVEVDGRSFRLGGQKFHVKGVTYGPFAPDASGQTFATPERTALDFALVQELGANVVRLYHVPPPWLLDLAAGHGLKVMVDVPWNQHLCFLDSREQRASALAAVRRAVTVCAGHPAVLALSLANEITPDILRWSGARAVAEFLGRLAFEAHRLDPKCLVTYSNFPPTEFLQPPGMDFVCFNVYLHQQPQFRSYLARLQLLADARPLLLGEFGMDSRREGEARKCAFLTWQIEEAFRAGLAGAVVFSFTDDWWRGGQPILDWTLGLTTRDRQPKDSFRAVKDWQDKAAYHYQTTF